MHYARSVIESAEKAPIQESEKLKLSVVLSQIGSLKNS